MMNARPTTPDEFFRQVQFIAGAREEIEATRRAFRTGRLTVDEAIEALATIILELGDTTDATAH
jgi:hypothetical protein